ncbi:MAG: hypothetical protein U1F15_06200 [Burkholderiales bacterium]
MDITIFTLGLATLSFVLGFVALLSSKVYVNPKTRSKLEVDLPLLGKMQTNYPALIFVFVGAALAVYSISKHFEFESMKLQRAAHETVWNVTGQFRQPGNDITDWRNGALLKLVQVGPTFDITADGHFTIEVALPEGETFESMVDQIAYTSDRARALIIPKEELDAYQKDKATSKLKGMTGKTRVYHPIDVEVIPATTAAAGRSP